MSLRAEGSSTGKQWGGEGKGGNLHPNTTAEPEILSSSRIICVVNIKLQGSTFCWASSHPGPEIQESERGKKKEGGITGRERGASPYLASNIDIWHQL